MKKNNIPPKKTMDWYVLLVGSKHPHDFHRAFPIKGGMSIPNNYKELIDRDIHNINLYIYLTPKTVTSGDVIVKFVESKHGVFRRAGVDLHTEITIDLREALLGFERNSEKGWDVCSVWRFCWLFVTWMASMVLVFSKHEPHPIENNTNIIT